MSLVDSAVSVSENQPRDALGSSPPQIQESGQDTNNGDVLFSGLDLNAAGTQAARKGQAGAADSIGASAPDKAAPSGQGVSR